jgi:hypothetical protein
MVRGWCQKHYQRLRKFGHPDATKRIKGDDEARFWSYVDKRGPDECWLWTGGLDIGGYGVFAVSVGTGKKNRKAHVWAYEHFIGPLPAGKPELDHACHTRDTACREGNSCPHRRCVNFLQDADPSRLHLEAVTEAENQRRAHRNEFPDELIAELYVQRLAGVPTRILAAEIGMQPRTLAARFHRMVERGDLPATFMPYSSVLMVARTAG